MKNSTQYLSQKKDKQKQSVQDKLRQDIKNFENRLKRIGEVRVEILDEIARDILKVTTEICCLFGVNNIEHKDETRKLIRFSYGKEMQYLE